MSKVIKFVKKEAVLFISLAAALISMIFTPPNPEYLGYVDWSTLGLLFCLMAAVQGFGSMARSQDSPERSPGGSTAPAAWARRWC